MSIHIIMQLLTGVSLFLFGMSLMGEGLKKVAGNRMEIILFHLTGSKLKATAFGSAVTMVIQSSSAVSAMAVGFVNSEIMKVNQAIPIVLGSILGTSITAWILCLSSIGGSGVLSLLSGETITCIAALCGIFLKIFCKNKQKQRTSIVLLGFATLMLGMTTMSDAMAPLRTNQQFINFVSAISFPLLSFLTGVVFSAILQSASAAVGILQILSLSGSITFNIAFPMILGISIGASLPVLLTAIDSKSSGKAVSFSYLFMTLIGSLVSGIIFYCLNIICSFSFYETALNPVSIALVNTLFRLLVVIMLYPFTGNIESFSKVFHKSSEIENETKLKPLDNALLKFPALAIEQSTSAINHMALLSKENVNKSFNLLNNFNENEEDMINSIEESVDKYEDSLGTYLLNITGKNIDQNQNKTVGRFLHCITDFERISDHAVNLSENAREIFEKKIVFNSDVKKELSVLESAVREITDISVDAFISNDTFQASKIEPLEDVIDDLVETIKLNHINRLQNKNYEFNSSFVFNDMLTNFERIADHCSNIGAAILSMERNSFNTHQYLGAVKKLHSQDFETSVKEYSEKYSL